MSRTGALLLAVLALPANARAQLARLPVGPSDSATIALIERAGAAWPRAPAIPPLPEHFHRVRAEDPDRFGPPPKQIGGAGRRCVAVPADGVMTRWNRSWVTTAYVRSGEFLVLANFPVVHGKARKIPWTPARPTPGMELLLRARNLTSPRETLRVTMTDVIGEGFGEPWSASFPTALVFPSPGRWVVVGTSGHNWGCVVLTVR